MPADLPSSRMPLDAVLLAARELAGLSRRELASRLGVSWDTVRQAEEGRDPRHSTLARYLEVLPFLGPGAVLGGSAASPPLPWPNAWRFHRDRHGFVARRLRQAVEVRGGEERRRTLELEGVRPLAGDLADPQVRGNLLRAVTAGSGELLRSLRAEPEDLAGRTRRAVEDGVVHEHVFPRALRRSGFRYVRRADGVAAPDAALQREVPELRGLETVAVDVSHPIEELELVLSLPAGGPGPRVAYFVAPEMAVPPAGAFELGRVLAPEGVEVRWQPRARRLVARIPRPLPGLRHGLAWSLDELAAPELEALPEGAASRSLVIGAPPAGTGLAARLRAARDEAGLSRRELARRMEVSPATVVAVEKGRDPQRASLVRWLEALPRLRPEHLFPGLRSEAEATPATCWLHQRHVTGIEALEARRTLTLSRSGDAREVLETKRLKRLHAPPGPLVVKDGISPSVHGRLGPVLVEGGASDEPEIRIRWTRAPGVEPEFQLVVPESLATRGATFTRRERKRLAYKMRSEHHGRAVGPAYECVVPALRLVLVVQFPRGWWPADVQASVRAAVHITNTSWPDLSDVLHPEGLRLRRDRAAGTVRLVVERPLLGFRYSVRWEVPENRPRPKRQPTARESSKSRSTASSE